MTAINSRNAEKGVQTMAVFRIQRTHDYTVMSNYHLRDQNLTLKAKGLLSMMLSLPDEWNYTTRGLAAICKEGVDAIGSTLKELKPPATSPGTSFGMPMAGFVTPSISFTSGHRKQRPRIRSHQIRKTRIRLPRVRTCHI